MSAHGQAADPRSRAQTDSPGDLSAAAGDRDPVRRDRVRIGTRGSQLALAQARLVAAAFEREGAASDLVVITTAGDRREPDTAWGEGAFVAAIQLALFHDEVDVAVHSAKDVPTEEDGRLRIAAYLPRADPRDVVVVRTAAAVRTLDDLPRGSRVGTDSPRRTGFVLARRPDLHLHALHGNVESRLRRLDEGDTDALVLAAAGLARLGRSDRVSIALDAEVVPPAPGQGAIAVQVRAGDARTLALAAVLDDHPTRVAVEAERAFLSRSGGGCRAPIGALARLDGDELIVLGGYARPDGSAAAVDQVRGPADERDRLVDELVGRLQRAVPGFARFAAAAGAGPLGTAAPGVGDRPAEDAGRAPRVLVTRPASQSGPIAAALRERGLDVEVVPAVEIQPPGEPELELLVAGLANAAWVVVTSPNGAAAVVRALRRERTHRAERRWAAVGPATAAILHAAGVRPVWLPSSPRAAAVGKELPISPEERILLARTDIADGTLPAALRERGGIVDEVAAYRTIEAPEASRELLRGAFEAGPPSAVLFASGSAVRGLLRLAEPDIVEACRTVGAICIGSSAATEARSLGFRMIGELSVQEVESIARLVLDLVRPATGVHE